ncbi:putative long-chain-alcohol O-fatty-acyltransferase 5 [Chlorella sorokiniana]|uniref:Long-chain-alcohol O-fatty-acyltransferase 5 n=1 Tax=Chlorella sorokiniana TaxID=3076 RepID=A0A2P6U1K4_CHLSO|nr:putative long-chain-alcohol O-fatty-acyltransferase 5 [Chlorella sorokiniana]|eukprot:PRW60188.1 putative long-chain-alcohol O-fatty-acyltransferase 5 [Chlorella sorokiniana]
MLLEDHSYPARLLALAAGALLTAAWVFAARRLAPGLPRLAAALPVLAFNCAAPLLFRRLDATDRSKPNEMISVGMIEFAFVWLCCYKVLAWVCNRGPLVRPWRPLQFAAIMLAPISPVEEHAAHAQQRNGRQAEHAGGAAVMAGAFAAKVALLAAGLALVTFVPLPKLAREFVYTLGIFSILSFAMDGPAAPISALLGVKVAPHFDAPFLATSLSDFWSHRWDLVAGNQLRNCVYAPIVEGQLVHSAPPDRRRSARLSAAASAAPAAAAQRKQRRLLGMAACFLVSGLMHEVQLWYMTGQTSRGLLTAFFAAQVPLLLAERWLGALLRRSGLLPPRPLRSVATLSVLLLLAHWTWWAAYEQYGVTQAAIDSLQQLSRAVLGSSAGEP